MHELQILGLLGQGFFTFAALRSKKSLQASHGLGTWDAQTEIPCLSTRGPRKPVLIWPSMATAAAIGKLADAQQARAETCTRTRPRSCTKRPSRAIATTPTNHPEREGLAGYMRERGVVRALAPVISATPTPPQTWPTGTSWPTEKSPSFGQLVLVNCGPKRHLFLQLAN